MLETDKMVPDNKFTSSFIAIPLPDKFRDDYFDLQNKCKNILPKISLENKSNPHITIYYLDIQNYESLQRIYKILLKYITSISKSEIISIEGSDCFDADDPRVIYLGSFLPQSINQFRERLTKELANFRAQDDFLKFTPHITLARIKDVEGKLEYKKNISQLEKIFSDYNWVFPIERICIYGVDSSISPEKQTKLFEIKL